MIDIKLFQLMPIVDNKHPNPDTFYPKEDYAIAKYFDLTKFLSLLQRKALFLCRLDKLEDPLEGVTGRNSIQLMTEHFKQLRSEGFYEVEMTDETILARAEELYNFQFTLKPLTLVSCWNKYKGESAALWKIYSDFSKGIMITSSIKKLEEGLKKVPEELMLSEVKYINHITDVIPLGNTVYPALFKHHAYNYEDEVRIIHRLNPSSGWKYDWSAQEIPEGLFVGVDLRILVDKIHLSPFAPKWYFSMIEDLIGRYNLNVEVNKSELY